MCIRQWPASNSVLLLLSVGWPPAGSDLAWVGQSWCGRELGATCRGSRAAVVLWRLVLLALPGRMASVFSGSGSRRICRSTGVSALLVLSVFFRLRQLRRVRRSLGDDSVAALVHAFIAGRVDCCGGLLVGAPGGRPTGCDVSSARRHGSSRARAGSTGDSLISGGVG